MSAITAKASRKMKKYAVLTREPRCFLGSFDFSWEQRKLSEITDKVTEKNAGLQYVETFTNSAEFGIISQRDFFDHDIAKLGSLDGYYIVKTEDFVYNPRISTSAPVGPINRNKLGRTGVMSPLYTVFRPHDIDTTYLEYFFKCGYWHSFMNFNGDSGARSDRFSIRDNVFFQMPIPIPDIDEQRKIGELLTCLDNLITLHQRKCALLFSPFQAFISMMFTTSTFSWEQRKLASLCEKFTDGDWIESKDQSDFGVRLVQTGNVGVAEYLDKTNNKKWISEDTFDRLHCEEVLPGDILISRLPEPAGRACIVPLLGTKMITAVDCTIVRTAPDMSNKFLVQYLSSQAYFDDVNTCLAGGTRQRISRGNLANFNVPIPVKKSEQDAIGMFFGYLDNLITLHQRKCIFFTGRAGRLISTVNKKRITSSWEQRKFEEIAVRSSVICSDDTLPRVEYEDIVSGTGRLNKDIYAKQSSKSGIVFHQGDVLYGKLRPYLQNWLLPTFDGLAVGDFWVLQPQNADSSFLYRLIQSRQFDEVANQSTGTKMPRADWKLVSKTVFSIPSNISEQAAIGTYFTALDSLITLHQRKFEKLTNVKKSMLEKMFPQNGSSYPEIRFKGFTDPWEQREVGDLLIERSQQAPMSDEYPLMAFIANEGVAPKGERYDRSALVTDTVNKLYKKTEKGDFIYSSNNLETGSIGLNKYGKACISPVYSIFEPTGIADSDFLGRRLVRKDFINAMVKWRQGVIYGQWRIHESDFLKIEISVPSVEEQRKIGAYLDQLDNLITLHQRELEKLQNIKKSMLEKMFV